MTCKLKLGTQNPQLILVLFWLVVTAFNLTKAIHIDDTAHLHIARAIREHPLHPMSGEFNWRDTSEPIHTMNQPHLFFTLLALTITVVGESTLALHLLVSLFSLAAIWLFHAIANQISESGALLFTALFCLSPAFMPSQNVMVDVPLVVCWLAFFRALLFPALTHECRSYLLAAAMASAALLIKYTSLVLLPLLALALGSRKRWRLLWVVAIPVATLIAWSLFNIFDYGGVHIFEREPASYTLGRLAIRSGAWLICLGAVSPFMLVFAARGVRQKRARLLVGTAVLLAVLVSGVSLFVADERMSTSLLRGIFFGCGLLLFGRVLAASVSSPAAPEERIRTLLIAGWFVGTTIFVIAFAPAVAVRHVLLVSPAALLALLHLSSRASRKLLVTAVALNLAIGVVLAISDYEYADVYREYAPRIQAKYGDNGRLWFVGHWGWKWYAEQTGMKEYDYQLSQPETGDLLVAPEFVDKQRISREHWRRLHKIDEIVVNATPTTFFRVGPMAGYYASSVRRLPWIFSTDVVEKFLIYRFE